MTYEKPLVEWIVFQTEENLASNQGIDGPSIGTDIGGGELPDDF